MFFVPFVLIGKDFFEPLCLLFCNLYIYRFGTVAYEELLAPRHIARTGKLPSPEAPLISLGCSSLWPLLYGHCPDHVVVASVY